MLFYIIYYYCNTANKMSSIKGSRPRLTKIKKTVIQQSPLLESKIKRDLAAFKQHSNKNSDDKISNDTLKGSYKSSFVEANSLHVKSDIYEIKKIIQKEIEPYIMKINQLNGKVNSIIAQKEKEEAKKSNSRANEDFAHNYITNMINNNCNNVIYKLVEKITNSKFQGIDAQLEEHNKNKEENNLIINEVRNKIGEISKIKENVKQIEKLQKEDGAQIENIKISFENFEENMKNLKQKVENKINKDNYNKYIPMSRYEAFEKEAKDNLAILNNAIKEQVKQIKQINSNLVTNNNLKKKNLVLNVSDDKKPDDNNTSRTIPNIENKKKKEIIQKGNKDNNYSKSNYPEEISKIQIYNNNNINNNFPSEINDIKKQINDIKQKIKANNERNELKQEFGEEIAKLKEILLKFNNEIKNVKDDLQEHEENFNIIQENFNKMKPTFNTIQVNYPKIEEILKIYAQKSNYIENKLKEVLDHLSKWESEIVDNFSKVLAQYRDQINIMIQKQLQAFTVNKEEGEHYSISQDEAGINIIPQGMCYNNVFAYTEGNAQLNSQKEIKKICSKKNNIIIQDDLHNLKKHDKFKSNYQYDSLIDQNERSQIQNYNYLQQFDIPYKNQNNCIEIEYEEVTEENENSRLHTNENLKSLKGSNIYPVNTDENNNN